MGAVANLPCNNSLLADLLLLLCGRLCDGALLSHLPSVVEDADDRTLSRNLVNLGCVVDNMGRWLLREPVDKPHVPSDEEVWNICCMTVLSYNVVDMEDPSEKVLDMSVMEHYNVCTTATQSSSDTLSVRSHSSHSSGSMGLAPFLPPPPPVLPPPQTNPNRFFDVIKVHLKSTHGGTKGKVGIQHVVVCLL